VLYTVAIRVSIVMFDWSEIIGGCNTADTVVKTKRIKQVIK